MKAAIYNPYLDSLGGGERYTMAVATVLHEAGYEVMVEWKDKSVKEQLENRFGIKLKDINFVANIGRGEGYDLCFWLSDGSIPLLRARKNILHFQVPFHDVNGRSLLNKMKLFRVSKIVCNSKFTQQVIDKEYGVNSRVIYPPVAVEKFKPKRKENIILFVGRFSQLKQSKNQHLLIKAFKRFYTLVEDGWQLVLAGGVEVGTDDYLKELESSLKGYPVEIIKSPDFDSLKSLYGRAKFFWSAVGYGENEEKYPEKMEHFGITLVEAMSAGVVPVVYKGGGYQEIINENCGYFWTKQSELVKITRDICDGPYQEWKKKSKLGIEKSHDFSYEVFSRRLLDLIKA